MSFIITTNSDEGVYLYPSGEIEVVENSSITINFTPNVGYSISKVLIDGVELENFTSNYTFENISSNHNIEIISEIKYINITSSSSEGGTIYPLGDINVQEGSSQSFNFFPNENYKVAKVYVDDVEVDNKSAYTFNNVTTEHKIHIEYMYIPQTFEISVLCGSGGSLIPDKTFKVTENDDQLISVVPDKKYELEYLLLDDEEVEVTDNQYLLENITSNHSLVAKFVYIPSYYSIIASSSEGGEISNVGEHSYMENSSVEYTFKPKNQYRIKDVIIDNVSYGALTSYTFSELSTSHTIRVEFENIPSEYIITTSCGEHGSLSQSGEIKVQQGTDFTLNIKPDEGYKISEIIIDSTPIEMSNVIILENIQDNHNISVTFEQKMSYIISASNDDNCKIYPSGIINMYEYTNQKFEISANSGYFIKSIKIDDVDVDFELSNTTYTFENITDNHTILIESEKIENSYQVCSISNKYGSIEPNGITSCNFGDTITYNFTPIQGYKLNCIIFDNKRIKTSTNTYTFYNIRKNHTITAQFVPINNLDNMENIDGLHVALNRDIYDRVEPSKVYLAKPKKHLLGVLNGIDENSCNITLRANNTFSLSFDVYRYKDGKETNYYDKIDVMMELYVSSIGWFKIKESPETSNDGYNEKLSIVAESYDIELQQYDKVGFVVNKASEDSLEMLATDNTYLDENGYVLFRDNVRFHRDTSEYETLLSEFTALDESEQNIDNLKSLLVNNPEFLSSAWRFDIDIDKLMNNITNIKSILLSQGYDTDYLDNFITLYNVKDNSTGETALDSSIIRNSLISHPELIKYVTFDINDQNINIKNKVFNTTVTDSSENLTVILNVDNVYCVQGDEIKFKVDVSNAKGSLTYRYNFGDDENCKTDYIAQNSIDWTSYYEIPTSSNYVSIPITVDVNDTYTDDNGAQQVSSLTVSIDVFVFRDNDVLSQYLIDNNIVLTYEEYETYSLVELLEMETQRMKDLSLLDQILLECPSWTVGFVDKYTDEETPNFLCDEVGSFEIDSQDVYSLLTQTMAQYFSCVFVFDTINMTVNAYRVGGIGKDTNIHLGFRNVQNEISITPSDELYTVFNVSNGEDLNLAYVNFGEREIEDISYFLNEDYLDNELIEKYKEWQDYRESVRNEYIDLSKLHNSQTEVVTELYNRVPVDGLETEQYNTFSYAELDEELHNYIALIEGIKSTFKLYVDNNAYEDVTIIASTEPDISYTYHGLRENITDISKSIYWNEYKQYQVIVKNILIAMYNFDKNEDNEDYCEYLDDWQWDMITYGYMYGLDELKAKLEVFENGMEQYVDYSLPYDETTTTNAKESYNLKREEYLKYKSSYEKCLIVLNEREIQVSIAESILNELYEKRDEIAYLVKKENWTSDNYPIGFTDEDLEKLGRLYKSTDYVNENIIYTSISSTGDIVDKAYELYEDAIENLYANAHPRLIYSTPINNILTIRQYADYMKDFALYNFIRVSIRDDYQVKLRVIEYSLNPMIYDNNLNLTFSNMIQYKSKRNDFASLLDNAISSAKNQISSLTKSTKENQFSFDYDLVKSLLNSKAFGNYMSSHPTTNISTEALEEALSRLDNISTDSAFIKYLNSNLIVSNEAYMDYLNSNLVVSDVADIRTLMFGSATGNVLQSAFSNSVISLLGDATIKSAMIESLNASKINAGSINTNNVDIVSESGNMRISDNTIQIKDDNDITRVQIGKDATNDYNMYVLDENGKVMFDATGLHEAGIKEGIIRDDMVSEDANISGDKLNIQSLYSSMNDSGYSLNASNVKLDGQNQSLEVSFNTLNSKVKQQGDTITSYGTSINVLQGQINSKIWKNDIETLVGESETISSLSNQFSEFEQEYDNFTTTVSKTYAKIEDVQVVNDIGIRNIILKSDVINYSTENVEFVYETSIPIIADSDYTFSIKGYANNSDLENGGFEIYFGNDSVANNILCTTENDTKIFKVKSPPIITDENHITIKNAPSETIVESYIEWICMYEGNITASSSWTPAPEDNATVSKEALTKATQTAEDFNWLVTKDENTSEMTLTDDAIELISKSIEINGSVSFGTFDESTRTMLSSEVEANTTMILKLYNGNSKPIYNPSNLILNAYRGYSEDRVEYSGRFKIEEFNNGNWNVIQDTTATSSTSFELKLSEHINSSSTQLRCSVYTDEENPILIDSITLDIVDDFSSMLSVKNNKTYVDGGNVYCANLDANAILSNDICFTGTITGGDTSGGGIIKSYNYVKDDSGLMIDLYNGSINSKNFSISENGKIEATNGTISNFNITKNSIYSGDKSSINNISKGIYMEQTGQFYFGDNVNYIRYYQSADGEYKLAISSDDITFGNGQSIETAIDNAISTGNNLIVLNDVKSFVTYGGKLKNSTKGITIDNYKINSNTKRDMIGFKINSNGINSTYTISGKTNLSKLKFYVSYWNDVTGALENYYSIKEHIIDVVDSEFEYTFNLLDNTTYFNIGIGMDNGLDYEDGLNSLCKLNNSDNSWIELNGLDRRYYEGSSVIMDNKLYVLGGKNSYYQMYCYDFSTSTWSENETYLPFKFINGSAVVCDNEIHILGGNNSTKKHYKFNNSTNEWIEVSTLPYNFYGGSAVTYNNEIHIIGGMNSPTSHYKYNPSTSTWTNVDYLPSPHYYGSAVVYNDEIHILGSYDEYSRDMHCKYSNANKYWELASTLPCYFYCGSAVVYNNEIHIIGTMDSSDNQGKKHFKFNGDIIDVYPWSQDTDLPYHFYKGSAVTYNNELYIIGGYYDSSYNYYIDELQLEKGSISTDWTPSTKDINSNLSDQLTSITNGSYSEITLPEVKTMERNGYNEHNINYYTFENNNIVAIYQPTEYALYAGFHLYTSKDANEYMLLCYDTNLSIGVCEMDSLGQPMNLFYFQTVNTSNMGGVTEDLVQYKFTVSEQATSFYVLLGHPYQNSFTIESVKLFKKTSNINTNLTVLGNLNTNCLNITDDTTYQTALRVDTSINKYDNLVCDMCAENGINLNTYNGDIYLKSGRNITLYTESGNVDLYTEYFNVNAVNSGISVDSDSGVNITGTFKHNDNVVLDSANYTTYCAKASHTHTIANITNLQSTLDGKANTHSHPYLSTSGGTVSGGLTVTGNTVTKGAVYFGGTNGTDYYCSNSGHIYTKSLHVSHGNLQIGTANVDNAQGLLMCQFNLGTNNASDGKRYYINNNGTARFNSLKYASSGSYSSRRYKDNIVYRDNDFWHNELMKMKICTFYYNNDDKTKHLGLIAEDLVELIPELVDIDEEGLPSSVEYANLTIPLIGEVQLLNSIVEEQNKKIDILQTEMNELKQLINKLLEM